MFEFYVRHEYWFAAVQLMLAMLGMGATLAPADFGRVFLDLKGFALGMLIQLVGVPLIAYALISGAGLSPGVAIGIAICAAIPGGTMSNILTYLARGHVALSIALTAFTTVACLVTTPVVLGLLVGDHMAPGFEMPRLRIATEIALTLLLPLAIGMLWLRLLPRAAPLFSRWCIRGSLFVIGLIVVGALGAGRLDLAAFGLRNVGVVFGFILALALLSWLLPRLAGSPREDISAINIEVTVRNTNLGLLIKASLLPAVVGVADPVADAALFAILLYGGLMLLVGGGMVAWLRRSAGRHSGAGAAPEVASG